MKRNIFFTVMLILIVVSAALVAYLLLNVEHIPPISASTVPPSAARPPAIDPDRLEISPLSDTGYGIAGGDFEILGVSGANAGYLTESLDISPDIPFRVEAEAGRLLLRLEDPLPGNEIIRIGLENRVWAFQTQKPFVINEVFPADSSRYVPVNSGIEVVFSHVDVSAEDFAAAFSIEPAAEGSFIKERGRLVFYPGVLEYNTGYRVTISGGLKGGGGTELGEDFVFDFRTADYPEIDYRYYLYENKHQNFLTGQNPVARIAAYSDFAGNAEFGVEIYAFDGAEEYADALEEVYDISSEGEARFDFLERLVSAEGMTAVHTETMRLTRLSDDLFSPAYLILPDNLGTGWYLADIRVMAEADGAENGYECHMQKLFQVSDISAGIKINGNDALLWLHDAATPLAGAEVSLSDGEGEALASADSGGIAAIRLNAPDMRYRLLKVTEGGRVFFDMVSSYYYTSDPIADYDFYTYMYTDRETYQSADTIYAWGVAAPRAEGAVPPRELRLSLETEPWNGGTVLAEAEAEILPGGTYKGSLRYGGLSSYTGYRLCLRTEDGALIDSKYISLFDSARPVYVIEGSTEKPFYTYDDMEGIKGGVQASFYDGSPAAGLGLEIFYTDQYNYSADQDSVPTLTADGPDSLTLDGEGRTDLEISLNSTGAARSWRPFDFSYYVQRISPGEEYVYRNMSVPVFPADTMFTYEVEEDGITLFTHRVDVSGLKNAGDIYRDFPAAFKGAAVGLTLTVTPVHVWYEREIIGTRYDFDLKQTVNRYQYVRREEAFTPLSVDTAAGTGFFAYPDYMDERGDTGGYFCLDIYYEDAGGRPVAERIYGLSPDYGYYDDTVSYWFSVNGERFGTEFAEGETLDVSLIREPAPDGIPAEIFGGELLYVFASEGLGEPGIAGASGFSADFSESLLPNTVLTGFYFDQGRIYNVDDYYLSYNPASHALSVDIAPAAVSYAPGDTASVMVTVKDALGNPVPGAQVLLSVTDEAAFLEGEADDDILNGLYRDRLDIRVVSHVSYSEYAAPEGGNGYGGGGDGDLRMRKDFLLTADFLTAATDSFGTARFEAGLPDNLTEWRLTALAVTPDLDAGGSRSSVVTTLPCFISALMSEEILQEDDFALSLSVFGSGMASGDTVLYTAEVLGEDTELSKSAEGNAYAPTYLNFGSLAAGDYRVRITAEAGVFSDGIEKTLSVRESVTTAVLSETFPLTPGQSISSVSYPVTLNFYDAGYKAEADALAALTAYSGGDRADRIAARHYLAENTEGENIEGENIEGDAPPAEYSLSGYADNGIAPFPFAEADPLLTALLAAADREYISSFAGRGTMVSYFWQVLYDKLSSSTEVAAAYLGLSVYGEPVLSEVKLLIDAEGFGDYDRLVLTAALAAAGDLTAAGEYFNRLVLPSMVTNADGAIILDGGFKDTAMAMVIASYLRLPYAKGMAQKLSAGEDAARALPELMIFLSQSPPGDSAASFSYFDGTGRRELSLYTQRCLSFSREGLLAADFEAEGEVMVTAFYTGAPPADSPDQAIALGRQVLPVKGEDNLWEITLTAVFMNPPYDGGYYIQETVPSGMRYAGAEEGVFIRREGQRLLAYVPSESFDAETGLTASVTYYARGVLPGNFNFGRAYIRHAENALFGVSSVTPIEIALP